MACYEECFLFLTGYGICTYWYNYYFLLLFSLFYYLEPLILIDGNRYKILYMLKFVL